MEYANFEQLIGVSKDRYMYIAVTLQVWCVEKESDSDEAKILADVLLLAVVLISLDCEPKLTMAIGFANCTMEFYVSVQLTYNSFAVRCSLTLAPSYSLLSTCSLLLFSDPMEWKSYDSK